MRWDREKNKAQTIFYWIGTIILILVVIGMLTDFISWKSAIGMIKKKLPTNAQVILGKGGSSPQYSPFRWAGPLKGRVYLFSDKEMNAETRNEKWADGKSYDMDGFLNGSIPAVSGINMPLKLINNNPNFPISYGKTEVKNSKGKHSFEIWVYLLNKGQPVYKQVFNGYKAVDYPITKNIVNTYRRRIDPDNTITEQDINWLCTFTHDSLHKYVISFFEQNRVSELFVGRNQYAYRLDQEISSKVKWERTYKEVWTGERKNACIGIIYKLDGTTYVRVVYNAWWIGCHGGGYIWDFWK